MSSDQSESCLPKNPSLKDLFSENPDLNKPSFGGPEFVPPFVDLFSSSEDFSGEIPNSFELPEIDLSQDSVPSDIRDLYQAFSELQSEHQKVSMKYVALMMKYMVLIRNVMDFHKAACQARAQSAVQRFERALPFLKKQREDVAPGWDFDF